MFMWWGDMEGVVEARDVLEVQGGRLCLSWWGKDEV